MYSKWTQEAWGYFSALNEASILDSPPPYHSVWTWMEIGVEKVVAYGKVPRTFMPCIANDLPNDLWSQCIFPCYFHLFCCPQLSSLFPKGRVTCVFISWATSSCAVDSYLEMCQITCRSWIYLNWKKYTYLREGKNITYCVVCSAWHTFIFPVQFHPSLMGNTKLFVCCSK